MTSPVILNVDDYSPGRYSRSRTLRLAGFNVLEASTGGEALQLLDNNPDLILLDVNLPDLGGFEVCRRIKQNEHTADIIVLHLSASSVEPADRATGLDNGADGYLIEPVEPEVLVATVKALLRARQAEAALRHTNNSLLSLTDMLSHELRTPIRGVLAYAELLEQKLAGRLDADEQQGLQHVLNGANRLREIVDGALEFALAEHFDEDLTAVSSEEVLAETLEELSMPFSESGAVIEHGPLPVVRASKLTVARLFSNLISNAIKYRGELPLVIVVSAQPQGAFWKFSVRDNGIGIDPRYHTRIFEMFKRLHGSDRPGIGVGLALCRRLVQSLGGRIWVESRAGEGSTFYFTLPAENGC